MVSFLFVVSCLAWGREGELIEFWVRLEAELQIAKSKGLTLQGEDLKQYRDLYVLPLSFYASYLLGFH